MSDLPLMIRDDGQRKLTLTGEANRLKVEALELGAMIGKVVDADSNQRAVEAQLAIRRVTKAVEEARKAAKDPVLAFGKHIDEQAKAFIAELTEEEWRLSRLVGDFQQLEAAKQRAAQAAEDARLAAIEREKAAELAKAQSHEQVDAIQAKFDNRAQQEAPPPPPVPVRATGQKVSEVWRYEVTDMHLLYRAHPNLVKLSDLPVEIKATLKAGITVKGIRAWKETQATVRVGAERPAIEA